MRATSRQNATSAVVALPYAHTLRQQKDRRSEARAAGTVRRVRATHASPWAGAMRRARTRRTTASPCAIGSSVAARRRPSTTRRRVVPCAIPRLRCLDVHETQSPWRARLKSLVGLSPREHQSCRAAIASSSPSFSLGLRPEPVDPLNLFPRTSWSLRCHTLPSAAPHLAGFRAPAAAPPLLRRLHSPATPPVEPPPPIGRGWVQLQPKPICLHALVPHHRRRARLRRRGLMCERFWVWRYGCEDLKLSRGLRENRFYPFVCLSSDLVNSIEIQGKSEKYETNFVSLLEKSATTFVKVVYTFVW
jgi:hypothetical protein